MPTTDSAMRSRPTASMAPPVVSCVNHQEFRKQGSAVNARYRRRSGTRTPYRVMAMLRHTVSRDATVDHDEPYLYQSCSVNSASSAMSSTTDTRTNRRHRPCISPWKSASMRAGVPVCTDRLRHSVNRSCHVVRLAAKEEHHTRRPVAVGGRREHTHAPRGELGGAAAPVVDGTRTFCGDPSGPGLGTAGSSVMTRNGTTEDVMVRVRAVGGDVGTACKAVAIAGSVGMALTGATAAAVVVRAVGTRAAAGAVATGVAAAGAAELLPGPLMLTTIMELRAVVCASLVDATLATATLPVPDDADMSPPPPPPPPWSCAAPPSWLLRRTAPHPDRRVPPVGTGAIVPAPAPRGSTSPLITRCPPGSPAVGTRSSATTGGAVVAEASEDTSSPATPRALEADCPSEPLYINEAPGARPMTDPLAPSPPAVLS